ncbi:glycosyltransferase family 1 protein [Actinoplanes sp. TBRC 11911]|uniref:glycosyltransferase n=1 Tax=Actinoplanes sp. TBRC 11911 TaxID=2729386 RepID=UPI00145DBA4B|nr:glycosyltransferase [Actinoplanes sp. TBRC 11911]NMO57797.1 glycosyltransferase family 1 protein [Actinoplanes sp. TBRC 11911]
MTALDGTREDLIVYLATGWWDGPAGTDRQLATALGRYGPVLYVDPPISGLTRFLKPQLAGVAAAPRIQVHTPRLARLVTRVTPGMTRPVLRHLRAPQVHHTLRSAVRELFGPRGAVAAVVSSRVDESWPRLPARHRLLHVTDDLVAGAELLGLPRERLIRLENAALAGADRVSVVSPGLRERYGSRAELVPNGCSPEAYAGVDEAPLPDIRLTGPVAGFVGHLNDRIDLSLLEAVADTGCALLIVGPLAHGYREADRFAALAGRGNVSWVGQRAYEELPSYLRLIDVGLTPYVDNAFNRASFPLKTLEYLAAGRAVVATSLPAHTWLNTPLITLADGPRDFAAQVGRALAQPRTPAGVRDRRSFAARHSWTVRAERMAELLGLTTRTSVG